MTDSRNAQPGSCGPSGYGAEGRERSRVAPDSGGGRAWPVWSGASNPAGWFPSPAGEAAPPVRHREPARSDGPAPYDAKSGPAPADQVGPRPAHPANAPGAPWPALSRLRLRQIPVLGPTEALNGPPGGPRADAPPTTVAGPPRVVAAPPGAVADHGHATGWQLAQRAWEESGVAWEEMPGPARDEWQPGAALPPEPGGYLSDPHPTRSDLPVIPAFDDSREKMGPWPVQAPSEESPPASAGRPAGAGGPAAPPLPRRVRRASTAWNDSLRDTPGQSGADGRRGQAPPLSSAPALASPLPPAAFAPASPFAPSPAFAARRPYESPRARGAHPGFRPPPLSAPVAPVAPSLGEPEELFRAWQGSVNKAAGRRTSRAARRQARAGSLGHRSWQVAKIGVPAVVIVTVGAGALMMLTGRANEMLAERASSGALSSGKPASGPVASGQTSAGPASAAPVAGGLTLAGYPAEHGTVGVTALCSAGGTTVAVGSADGHPAVWRHAAGGTWSLVSTALLGGVSGDLASVAQGPSGWIAVGAVTESGIGKPAVFSSADGVTWQRLTTLSTLAGGDARFLGVAAGPGGYLVAGAQGPGRQASVALWWSNDLKNWVSGEGNGPAGSYAAAAAATAGGFVAVGSENNSHALWTSADGQHWTAHDIANPSGATAAALTSVAAGHGGQFDRFVAAGVATTSAGDIPIVVTAANDGTHISQTVLGSAGAPAAVTAVTAAAGGFVAVGAAGPANAQRPVTWTSQEGRIWTPPAALTAAGGGEISALTATGSGTTLTATASRGANPAVLTIKAP